MESSSPAPGVWNWENGILRFRVEYDATGETLTWIEEVAPEDDERGYGSYAESTQTHAEFLQDGPQGHPPVAIIEALLTHLQTPEPLWFDPYRLLVAVRSQDRTAVGEMLARGVPADWPMNGVTPIDEAVRQRSLSLTEMLLEAGVDVNRRSPNSQETVLMTLAASAPDASWEPLAARIVAQGAGYPAPGWREARNAWGETALMYAASAGNRLPGLVALLLQAGAEVNARSTHGYTALMKSVMARYAPLTMVQQLLDAGADVNARDAEGWSALMWAISNGLVPSVRCLLEAGADVHAVSAPTQKYRAPKSVLQLAIDYANPEIIALLREASEAGE